MRFFFRPIIGIVVLCSLAVPAFAQVQNAEEQGCINALNNNGAKVAKAQGKENAGCIKAAGRNTLNVTADTCMAIDEKGKIAKARAKTTFVRTTSLSTAASLTSDALV